jgi:hypothetical protein
MQSCLALPVSDSSPFHVVLLLPLRRVCMTKEESGRQLLKRNFIHAEGDQRLVLLLMETWSILEIVTNNFSSLQVIREILQQFFIQAVQAVQAETHDDDDESTTTNQSSIIISIKSSSNYQTFLHILLKSHQRASLFKILRNFLHNPLVLPLVATCVNILPFYIDKKKRSSAYAIAVLFGVLSKLCVAKPEMLPKLHI